MNMNWTGVMPAITTCFDDKLAVDHAFMATHCQWMMGHGCAGIVALGSLGEGATVTADEKLAILKNLRAALGNSGPLVAAVSDLSTAGAVRFAKSAADAGCDGLMVLPPYVYKGDWREMKAHMAAVLAATDLSCMLYNNPIAYGTDFTPPQVAELAQQHANLHAVKESSTDVRRITAIRELIRDRLRILVGIDDMIVEGIAAGAVGWIAGLVNAFPQQSVDLLNYSVAGKHQAAFDLYRCLLPLLRLDTVPKFVQLIKFVQQEVGMGSARVRPPRLEITPQEAEQTRQILRLAQSRMQPSEAHSI
ncbi:MAG: dihydrodipicolinate synthase family protein [Acidobacteriaceae bacterium]